MMIPEITVTGCTYYSHRHTFGVQRSRKHNAQKMTPHIVFVQRPTTFASTQGRMLVVRSSVPRDSTLLVIVLLAVIVFRNLAVIIGTFEESPRELLHAKALLPTPRVGPAQSNKTLVIAVGSLATIDELTCASLYSHVVNPLRADLALLIDGDKPPMGENSMAKRAAHVWSSGSTSILKLGASLQKFPADLFEYIGKLALLSDRVRSLADEYNHIVITRTESFFLCPMDVSFVKGGPPKLFTDGTLVLAGNEASHTLDLLSGIVEDPPRYIRTGRDPNESLNMTMTSCLRDSGIALQVHSPIAFSTTTDSSSEVVVEGVRRQDRLQYIRSRETCARMYPPKVIPPPPVPEVTATGKKSTLVIVMGNLRGGELAWQSLYRNVLAVNDADLALMIGDTAPQYQNSTMFDRAEYVWSFPEYEDWADALDLIHESSNWRETLIPLAHPEGSILGGVKAKDFKGSGAVIFMIRWFISQKIQELDLTSKYERFIITRSDHYYYCEHDLSELDNESLWIPEGEDYKGITDRHLVVSAQDVLAALNILPPLLSHPEDYGVQNREFNPERLILQRWTEEGLVDKVRRFSRMMFTCGQEGDTTRWRKLGLSVKEGVQLKYSAEYYDSELTCYNRDFRKA